MIKKLSLTLVVAALAAFGLTACGSSSSDSTSASTTAPSTTPAAGGGGSAGGGSTVDISADPSGQLAFQQKSATAKAGDVTVSFTNDSSLTHDVCVEPQGSEDELGCTDQISGSTASKDLGNLKPGTYTYYCSVDGHEAAGMTGTLTVK